jgi:hypothetical protein
MGEDPTPEVVNLGGPGALARIEPAVIAGRLAGSAWRVTKWVTIRVHFQGRWRTAAHELTCVTAVCPQVGTRLKSGRSASLASLACLAPRDP